MYLLASFCQIARFFFLVPDGIAMFALDYEILVTRTLRVFHQLWVSDALTRGASFAAASPRPDAAACGGRGRPRRGGRAAAEVRRRCGGEGQIWPQTPELPPWKLCQGDPMTSCLVPSHSEAT